MATLRQVEANRRNALMSTGPRTANGKAKSRFNAMKHGLASVHASMPHENPADFAEFRQGLIAAWQPVGAQELLQVDLVADALWRMARGNKYEAEFFAEQLETIKRNSGVSTAAHPHDDRGIAIIMTHEGYAHAVKVLSRYSDRAASKYFRAIDRLEKMQAARRRNATLASFGQAVTSEAPATFQSALASQAPACQSTTDSEAWVEPARSFTSNELASFGHTVTSEAPACQPPACQAATDSGSRPEPAPSFTPAESASSGEPAPGPTNQNPAGEDATILVSCSSCTPIATITGIRRSGPCSSAT
jgi:hypothetical protein